MSRFRVGTLEKTVHVSGERTWFKRIGGGIGTERPEPFERIPLVYERAFGGWDRTHAKPEKHTFEPRNPVGRGLPAPVRGGGTAPEPRGPAPSASEQLGRHATARRLRLHLARLAAARGARRHLRRGLDADAHAAPAAGLRPPLLQRGLARPGERAGYLARRRAGAGAGTPRRRASSRSAFPGVPAPACTLAFHRQRRPARCETRLDTVIVDADGEASSCYCGASTRARPRGTARGLG